MNAALMANGFTELALASVAGLIVEQVVRASLGGLLLGAVVWGVTRLWPALPAGVRCALWWAVSLKFLVTLVWLAPLELPVLPPVADPPAVAAELDAPPARAARDLAARAALELPARALIPYAGAVQPSGASSPGVPWREALMALWLLGVGFGALGIGREVATARRLRRESRPIDDAILGRQLDALRRRLRVRRRVALRVGDTIDVPLTLGWLRPAIVLPAGTLSDVSGRDLRMVLGHELLHVRRWDLWTGWIPRLVRCLFFFHPLAILAAREYALAREAACDAALVRELDVAPRDYGRLLVRWRPREGRLSAEGVGCAAASSSFHHLKRRLEMLQRSIDVTGAGGARYAPWVCMSLIAVAVVPVRIVAQPPPPPAESEVTLAQVTSGSFERVVQVGDPVLLDVRTGSGSITVRPGASGQVRVMGLVRVRDARGAEDLVRRIETDPPIEVTANTVRIGHDLDRDLQRNVSISYEIDVPANAEVRSHTGSGSQSITGVAGPVEAGTGSGGVTLSDIGGRARVETGSGSIRADGVAGAFTARTGSGSVSLVQNAPGDVDVSTGSGSTEVRGINGGLRVRTGSGGITVEGSPAAAWDLQTGSGSIRLRLPPDVAFDLDASSASGRIQNDHPLDAQGADERRRSLRGQVRGGGPRLRLQTASGSVRIE